MSKMPYLDTIAHDIHVSENFDMVYNEDADLYCIAQVFIDQYYWQQI